MLLYTEHRKSYPEEQPPDEQFVTEPYDNHGELLDRLIERCRHCGDFLIRRNGRQEYCDKPDCQKARNAKNQREFRRRKRIENTQKHKKTR